MAFLHGNLQRPIIAVSAAAVASISALHDKVLPSNSSNAIPSLEQTNSSVCDSIYKNSSFRASQILSSKLSNLLFVTRIRVPVPDIKNYIPNRVSRSVSSQFYTSMAFSLHFVNSTRTVNLAKAAEPAAYTYIAPSSPSDVLYRWHLPDPNAVDVSGLSDYSTAKSKTVVVLLGWLGSKQNHLSRYADWYTSRGFHVITFTFPMADVLSYKVGGKSEQEVELLVNHLADWLEEEHGKTLVFHTFSNTGWLTYGVMLEKFQLVDPTLVGKIKGCIVDSAPAAAPDPQVWASGFSAAFLKKRSVATKSLPSLNAPEAGQTGGNNIVMEAKPDKTEAMLLAVLGKIFGIVLNRPNINRRLSDVLEVLTSRQPNCPQLYIYSSADKVIPAGSVESFMEKQRTAGRDVRACNFISTPHVDHFRNDPELYGSQLTQFLDDCVLTNCKRP
ncbi:hypothetical protein Leryth_013877 [Lithospermum erythrorhizon]|nr:hypothetical protein Leryth_013877 [Lithospermum erythrorhizon]